MSPSRILSGLGALLLGGFVAYQAVVGSSDIWGMVWGGGFALLCVGIALYLFFNTKEDDIEEITSDYKDRS
ncbi:hypothetical protein GVX82_03260 [Patescibacteria group bacterium]|jgi:hypothetical protein|nr:hypothetical protein [Patescibacteria group bacterium]